MTAGEDRAARGDSIVEHDAGTVLYQEGDPGATLFIIQQGAVELRRQRGERQEVEHVQRGDFFGELSVISGSARDATATAVEPLRLLEIDVPTFERMLKANAEIAVRIIHKMATRIDRLSRRPASSEIRMALAAAADEMQQAARVQAAQVQAAQVQVAQVQAAQYAAAYQAAQVQVARYQAAQAAQYQSAVYEAQYGATRKGPSPLAVVLLVLGGIAGVIAIIAAVAMMQSTDRSSMTRRPITMPSTSSPSSPGIRLPPEDAAATGTTADPARR